MKCSKCGYENPPEMKYCGMCGALVGTPCPRCNFVNPANFLFCGMCANELIGGASPAAVLPASLSPNQELSAQTLNVEKLPETSLLEGERRIITVILADVFGSTTLLEHVGNEAWVDLMNRLLSSLEAEIYRFGGQVDQFRGDGLVAFFGAQTASEDDPERAVLAGLAMQQKMAGLAREVTKSSVPEVKLRVGINTGEVIVAGIGEASQHREDTAMGIAITIAARMESSAEPGTVLVSENTYRQISSRFVWQALGETSVKGLSQPIAVYRPIASNSDPERLSDLEVFGYAATMVGRDEEFNLLKQKIQDLESGRGGIILLSGEFGVGKNGLIRELRQYVLRNDALLADAEDTTPIHLRHILWLSSRVKTYYGNSPYSVWTEFLNSWLGVFAGDDREQVRERLWLESERIWGERVLEFYPYLAKLLDLPLSVEHNERIKYLDAEALRLQFLATIKAWLEEMVKNHAVILVATGMEWSDPSSVDMINFCLPLVEEVPVLWLFAYRQERSADIWNLRRTIEITYASYLLSIDLKPLTYDQSAQLIQSLVGADTLPEEVRDLLIKNAEGMPAYIIEIFRTLIENEILVQDPASGKWHLTRQVTTLDMPANLQRLLQARLDRLGDEERFILQLAAVVGPIFWVNILQALLGESKHLREQLDVLIQAQFIERSGKVPDLGTQYSFKTNLIREAAYESLLVSQREWYHLKTASVLEEMADLQARYYQALIAYHYRHGGDLQKELFYTIWAAEKASEFYASAEAIEHYTRALELLEEMESYMTGGFERKMLKTQKFEVLSGRYMEYYRLGEVDAGNADSKALLEIAKETSDEPTWTIDAILRQPEVALADQIEHIEPGLGMIEEALNLSRTLGDHYRQLHTLEAKAKLLFIKGELAAFESAKEALVLARELGDAEAEVSLLLKIVEGYGMDNVGRAEEYLQKAVEVNRRIQNKDLEIDLLGALGEFEERQGNYYRLLVDFEARRLELCREIGDKLTEGFVMMYSAQIKGLYLGDYEVALAEMRKAFKLTKKVASSIYPLLRIVQLQCCMGNFEEAESTLNQLASPLAQRGAFELGRGALDLNSAILRNRRGTPTDRREVLDLTDRVKRLAEESRISWQFLMAACCEATEAHLALAGLEKDESQRQVHLESALTNAERACKVYRDYGFVQISECVSEEVLYRRGLALAANGRAVEAGEAYQQAYEEMMRKYQLIPADSPYRKTYLENIVLHQDILTAFEESNKKNRRKAKKPAST